MHRSRSCRSPRLPPLTHLSYRHVTCGDAFLPAQLFLTHIVAGCCAHHQNERSMPPVDKRETNARRVASHAIAALVLPHGPAPPPPAATPRPASHRLPTPDTSGGRSHRGLPARYSTCLPLAVQNQLAAVKARRSHISQLVSLTATATIGENLQQSPADAAHLVTRSVVVNVAPALARLTSESN